MAQELADARGSDLGEAFLTLCAFLEALAFASRRQLVIRAPAPFGATSDERRVLAPLAAGQSGDHALFQAPLRWLVRRERRPELQITPHALANAFKAKDLPLALPPSATPDSRERPHAVT